MPMEQFSQHLLPSLLSLSSDPVANVRVLVAKALRQSVMEKGRKQTNSIICVCNIFVIANKSIEKTKTNSFCFFLWDLLKIRTIKILQGLSLYTLLYHSLYYTHPILFCC